jgi:hypothetical protein
MLDEVYGKSLVNHGRSYLTSVRLREEDFPELSERLLHLTFFSIESLK